MLNQTVIIGRLIEDPILIEEKGKKNTTIKISVPRSWKNVKGEYEEDVLEIFLNSEIAENTVEYCKKGDLIGVKGRLQNNGTMIIVAEKVTFLSSREKTREE
jgi:single-strand DNA-binding protein